MKSPFTAEGDTFLVDLAIAGDKQALNDLIVAYTPWMTQAVSKVMYRKWNKEEVEDTMQELLLRLPHKLAMWRRECKLSTFLYKCAFMHALHTYRSLNNRAKYTLVSIDNLEDIDQAGMSESIKLKNKLKVNETQTNTVMLRQLLPQLEDVMMKTSPGYWMVFKLRDIEGYEIVETAQILGITQGAVKSQLCKARQKIRHIVKKDYIISRGHLEPVRSFDELS